MTETWEQNDPVAEEPQTKQFTPIVYSQGQPPKPSAPIWEQDDLVTDMAPWERGDTVVGEGPVATRMIGAAVGMEMKTGEALLRQPSSIVRLMKPLVQFHYASEITRPGTSEARKKELLNKMKSHEIHADALADELDIGADMHKQGQQVIMKNHPEWQSNPPKSFKDLITSPDKIAVSLVGSLPLLLNAGILTAAGQPHVAVALMYVAEGQEAREVAAADGQSKLVQDQAAFVSGSVSACLEYMQLQGVMKIAKGMYSRVLNRTVQKVAQKGIGSFVYPIIKVAAQEALEEMSQGTWGEITSKILYDKSIEGGLAGFIDRRLQEGFLGFLMGVIPGGAGAVTGSLTRTMTPAQQIQSVDTIKETVQTDTVLTKEEKATALKYIGDIETKILEDIRERFSGHISNQDSLQEIGNQIAEYMGVEGGIDWVYSVEPSKRDNGRVLGTHRPGFASEKEHVIKIYAGTRTTSQMKEAVVHELGHIVAPPTLDKQGEPVEHHKKFKAWVRENVQKLNKTEKQIVPVSRKEAIGPVSVEAVVSDEDLQRQARKLAREEVGEKPVGIGSDLAQKIWGKKFFKAATKHYLRLEKQQVKLAPTAPVGKIVSMITAAHNKDGGSTINMQTGKPVKTGYAVAITESVEEVIPSEQLTDGQVEAYRQKHADLLAKDPRYTIGTWVSDGKSYLDISMVMKSKKEAMEMALESEQEAIFNLKTKEDIATDKYAAQKLTRKQALTLGHDIPSSLGLSIAERRDLMELITGERSMKSMTKKQRTAYITELIKLSKDITVTERGEREFREPTIFAFLTPQTYEAELLGVKSITEEAELGKQRLDVEFAHMTNLVDKHIKMIDRDRGTTRREKARAALKNQPTRAVKLYMRLLERYESAPAFLNEKQTEIFNFFRNLSKDMIKRENEVRNRIGLDPIPYRKGYVRHVFEGLAKDIIDGSHPIPQDLAHWARKQLRTKIYNPMQFQRKLAGELRKMYSRDLERATKAMLWTGLKEIHLSEPLEAAKNELNMFAEIIPPSTRQWTEKYLNEVIKGQEPTFDRMVNNLIVNTGFGRAMNKMLRPFGRVISSRPVTGLFQRVGRWQIHGVMGWRPKQLIRNKFQILQTLALYSTKAVVKSFVKADATLTELMDNSLFLKTYTAYEELPTRDLNKLSKLWLAPFQWTAVTNVKRAMKASYFDTLELITDSKYKDFGWADPQRTYEEEKGFLYESEKAKLLKEMEFGASATQYHYIPMGMPQIFRYKALTPVTRLQSWWMNHFFKFHREAGIRMITGETGYGTRIPWSRRIGWARYMLIGGVILNTLGYGKSYLFGAAPSGVPPIAQVMWYFYRMMVTQDEKERKSAYRKFMKALKTFLPGYLAVKDVMAYWENKSDWSKLFFYNKGIFGKKDKGMDIP